MANCGLRGCRSAVSDKSQGDKSQGDSRFKGPCGLPDCQNDASAWAGGSRSGRRESPCGLPWCTDSTACRESDESCLTGRRVTSVFRWLSDTSQLLWAKIRDDPYYWSLFKASVYFLLGLKLFGDLAAEFSLRRKCVPRP